MLAADAFLARFVVPLIGRLAQSGAVLCLHSLATPARPAASSVHLTPGTLVAVLETLRRFSRWVPLHELVERLATGRSTRALVAVSFDDAYEALRTDLPPVLRAYGVPVTVFAVSEAARTGARFWWDRVDEIAARLAPPRWRDFEDACGLPPEYRSGQPAEFGPVRPLRQWILAVHRGRWPTHLDAALARWEEIAGAVVHHRAMTYDEMKDLQAAGNVDIGVHTATHPVLPLLSDDEMMREIVGCRDELTRRLGRCVPLLAAPFGLYDARTVALAQRCGMAATLTLAGTTFRTAALESGVPRFCLTRGVPVWRIAFQVAGAAERARRWVRRAAPAYPAMPSATT